MRVEVEKHHDRHAVRKLVGKGNTSEILSGTFKAYVSTTNLGVLASSGSVNSSLTFALNRS